ncbi:MAG: hypothetical protein J0M02_10365 [Planctomycetes bacterium]|nr:hypothetical protein [Planctomycetota bacterium]
MRILLAILVASLLLAAEPVPRGGRVLAIDINQSQRQALADDFDAAWSLAAACGVQNIGLSLDWNSIETAPGVFSDPGGYLLAANTYYAAQGATLTLTLRPLHNVVKPVPADLAATPFEDPSHTMATRFCAMLDWVMAQLPDVGIEALVIGSEYDVYLANHPAEWSDYGWFVARVADHVRAAPYAARVPRIAAEATFDGYSAHADAILAINGVCDVAGVSYYAIGTGFDTKDATAIRADLDALLAFASAAKPLSFYQFGCPSSWKDGSGTVHDRGSQQAAFIAAAFAFWDAHPAEVRLMDFTWLHDLDPATLAAQGDYFGSSDPAFINFLASLGLRTWPGAGAAKSGYTALRRQAFARGWGGVDPDDSGGDGGSSGSGGTSAGGTGGCGAGAGAAAMLGLLLALALRPLSSTAPRRSTPQDRRWSPG